MSFLHIRNSDDDGDTLFPITSEEGVTLSDLRSAFPTLTSLRYKDGQESQFHHILCRDGVFVPPHDGWDKDGRVYTAISRTDRNIAAEKLEVTIKRALEMGYRHIDTAFVYGNEAAIGEAHQGYMECTNLTQQEVSITTKELDIYPETPTIPLDFISVDLRETWKAMEETVDKGKARSIGVSNFNSKQLDYICETARIQPAVNQVEAHARFPQKKLHQFCRSRNVLLEAFCPLGSPFFIGPPKSNKIQSSDNLVEHPIIVDIAEKYKCTPGQVLLRNLVQRGIVVIPKSENPQRMKENLQIFSFSLSEEDMNRIDELDNGQRRFVFTWLKDHPEYPFNEEF